MSFTATWISDKKFGGKIASVPPWDSLYLSPESIPKPTQSFSSFCFALCPDVIEGSLREALPGEASGKT